MSKYPDFESETELNLETLEPFLHNFLSAVIEHGSMGKGEIEFLKALLFRCSPYAREKYVKLNEQAMAHARWDSWNGEDV